MYVLMFIMAMILIKDDPIFDEKRQNKKIFSMILSLFILRLHQISLKRTYFDFLGVATIQELYLLR